MTHPRYNRTYYPRLVWARADSNWHIYADSQGRCAAIPVKPGALASDFGDLAHVRDCKHRDAARRDPALAERCKRLWRWIR